MTLEQFDGGDSRVTIALVDGRKFIGTDVDWFRGLRTIRRETDKLGIKILVQGSRPNCWPSGMSASMSNGTKIYERDLNRASGTWRIVNSFDEAIESEIGTVEDQDGFNSKLG